MSDALEAGAPAADEFEEWYLRSSRAETLELALRNLAIEVSQRLRVPENLQLTSFDLRKTLLTGVPAGKKLNRLLSGKYVCDLYDASVTSQETPSVKYGQTAVIHGPDASPAAKIRRTAGRVLGEMIELATTRGKPFTLPQAHVARAGYAVEIFFYSHVLDDAK